MVNDEIEVLKRSLEREKKARAKAESLVEESTRFVYAQNQKLKNSIIKYEQDKALIYDNMHDAMFVFSENGEILDANKSAYQLTGHSQRDLSLKHIDAFSAKNAEKVNSLLTKIFKSKKNLNGKFSFTSRNGVYTVLQVRSKLINLGTNLALHVIASDITERTKIEKKLKRDKQYLGIENEIISDLHGCKKLLEAARTIVNGLSVLDQCEDVSFYVAENNMFRQIASSEQQITVDGKLKTPAEFYLGKSINNLEFDPLEPRMNHYSEYSGEPDSKEGKKMTRMVIPCSEGDQLLGVIEYNTKRKWENDESHYSFLKHLSKYISLALHNIISAELIEKKQAEINKFSKRLQAIISNLPRGIAFQDKENIVRYTNQKFVDIFRLNVSPEEIVGTPCDIFRHKMIEPFFIESANFNEHTVNILKKRQVVNDDRLKMKDGRTLTRHFAPIYEDGQYFGSLWAYEDKTIETRYDENLNLVNQKYQSILENMQLGILEVDNDDNIVNANKAFLKMLEYQENEIIGKKANDLFLSDKENFEETRKINKNQLTGNSGVTELRYLTKDKKLQYIITSRAPNRDKWGQIIGSIGIHLDISHIKELQEKKDLLLDELKKSNEQLSNYAHVVSHDLKTPLRSISAAINWLIEDSGDQLKEMSQSYISIITKSLSKMERIISDTLAFSELESNSEMINKIDLNYAINNLILELEQSYPETAINVEKNLPSIKIEESKAVKIFQNILENSCKYRVPDRESVVNTRFTQSEKFHEIQIKDNGIGIPEDEIEKIFNKFYSVEKRSDSSGIGLHTVKETVESLKGRIRLSSEVNKGTTVIIQLPVTIDDNLSN